MRIFTKTLSLAILLAFTGHINAQVILATWTFANNSLNDTIQNGILPLNLNESLRTEGTLAITMTNGVTTGDYAATATGWDNGADVKNWNIHISTIGYNNITLSSKQRSGNTNAGPINWKAQYKVGQSGIWTDVVGGTITVANDWTGVLNNVALPIECSDVNELFIRWIMTSNIGIGGGTVGAAGTSKIDDVVIKGTAVTGIEDVIFNSGIAIYPNPATKSINLNSTETINELLIYNFAGQSVYNSKINSNNISIDVEGFESGLYFIKTINNKNEVKTQKFEIFK